jgi:hypothetical protein
MVYEYVSKVKWAFVSLFASHLLSFLKNYVGKKEYLLASNKDAMLAPYSRIIIMHLTILFGGWMVMLLGSPIWALFILIAIKTTADIKAHLKQRQAAAAPPPTTI